MRYWRSARESPVGRPGCSGSLFVCCGLEQPAVPAVGAVMMRLAAPGLETMASSSEPLPSFGTETVATSSESQCSCRPCRSNLSTSWWSPGRQRVVEDGGKIAGRRRHSSVVTTLSPSDDFELAVGRGRTGDDGGPVGLYTQNVESRELRCRCSHRSPVGSTQAGFRSRRTARPRPWRRRQARRRCSPAATSTIAQRLCAHRPWHSWRQGPRSPDRCLRGLRSRRAPSASSTALRLGGSRMLRSSDPCRRQRAP